VHTTEANHPPVTIDYQGISGGSAASPLQADAATGERVEMTAQTTIIISIIAIVVVLALLAARRGGPRVTEINRVVRRDKDSGDA
jgi:hypothetical protein